MINIYIYIYIYIIFFKKKKPLISPLKFQTIHYMVFISLGFYVKNKFTFYSLYIVATAKAGRGGYKMREKIFD